MNLWYNTISQNIPLVNGYLQNEKQLVSFIIYNSPRSAGPPHQQISVSIPPLALWLLTLESSDLFYLEAHEKVVWAKLLEKFAPEIVFFQNLVNSFADFWMKIICLHFLQYLK